MVRKLRAHLAAFFTVLLFWQAGLAPFAHAALFHSSPGMMAASVPAEAHSADVQTQVAPCHGDAGTQAAVVSHQHAGHDLPPTATMAESVNPPAVAAPDCCESLACQCACVHASLGGAAIALVLPVIPDHPGVLGAGVPSLAARTAELFRPPI